MYAGVSHKRKTDYMETKPPDAAQANDPEHLNTAFSSESAYSEVAEYMQVLSVPSVVLNGVHPITGDIGRDVDILVPDAATGIEVARFAHENVFERLFRWSFLANPQWGPRAFAASTENSMELHTVTGLRMGPIPWSGLIPWEPVPGPHGFYFDDVIMTFRLITKMNKAIIKRLPIWETENAFTPLKSRRVTILQRLQSNLPSSVRLVELMLEDDSPEVLRKRRSAFLRFLLVYCVRHPVTATKTFLSQRKRRANALQSPSGVYVSLFTDRPIETVQSELNRELGHAFVKITCKPDKIEGSRRDELLARQQLVIHIASTIDEQDRTADIQLGESTFTEPGAIVELILDTLVAVNQKYRDYYVSS